MRPMKDVSLASQLLKMFLVGHFRSVIVVSSIGCGGHPQNFRVNGQRGGQFRDCGGVRGRLS